MARCVSKALCPPALSLNPLPVLKRPFFLSRVGQLRDEYSDKVKILFEKFRALKAIGKL